MSSEPHKEAPPSKSGKVDFWFPILVKDMNRIRECCPDTASTRFMAWAVLCREANFKQSRKVIMTDKILADRCGLHIRSIDVIKTDLSALKLLTYHSKRIKGKHTPTEYTLIARPKPQDMGESSAINADGLPSVMHGGVSIADTLTSTFSGQQKPPKNVECKTKEKEKKISSSLAFSGGLGAPGSEKDISSLEEGGKAGSVPDAIAEIMAKRKASRRGSK